MALEKATAEISNKQPLTLQEVVSIKQTLGLNNANLQGTFTLAVANDVVVPAEGTFDITPDTIVSNTFGDTLELDEANRLFTTFNNEQLNLQARISVPLNDTQGTEETHLVYLQRGNETTPIETTIASVKGRRFAETTDAGLVLTYTSGVNDPFNNAGFRVIFQNDGLFPITVRAGEVRVDVFAVYDLDELINDVLDSTTTLLTNSTEITFERNSIHGTKDIPLASGTFDLTKAKVGNVVQFWLNGSDLPTDDDLIWTNDTDQNFVEFERCLLTLNLHPDNVIVGTLTNL